MKSCGYRNEPDIFSPVFQFHSLVFCLSSDLLTLLSALLLDGTVQRHYLKQRSIFRHLDGASSLEFISGMEGAWLTSS